MSNILTPHHRKKLAKQTAGFTIIELMIATTAFSVILLLVTVGVVYFTRSYYNGVYNSATQNAARDITTTVSNVIRFGSGAVSGYDWPPTAPAVGTPVFFCAGGYVFVTKLGEQYDGTTSTTGMYMQPMDPGGVCGVPVSITGRKQLLGEHMSITSVSLAQSAAGGLYVFDIGVAYGDNDLLTDGGVGSDVRCKPGSGSEFCAIVKQSISVKQRVASD